MYPAETIKSYNQLKLSEKVKIELLRWCKRTTIDGIPHITRSTNWTMRALWILFFTASIIFCLFAIMQTLIAFYDYTVTMTISRVQEMSSVFPAVTICNLNPYNENRSYEFFADLIEKEREMDVNLRKTNNDFDALMDHVKRVVANHNGINDNYMLGYHLENEMLLSCEYNSKKCTHQNFSSFWSNEFGTCYLN